MRVERPAWTRRRGGRWPATAGAPDRTVPGGSRARVGRASLALWALLPLALTGAPRADELDPASFEGATQFVAGAPAVMETRLREIEALHDRAVRDGTPIRASCIEQKQRQIREALGASREVVEGWPLARSNPEFRERSLYRMQVLKQYSAANADAAYACVDGPPGTTRITVEFLDPGHEAPPGSGSEREPTVERQPLASRY